METDLIIKGGKKELDLFFKAESYYNSVLVKMWEIKENNKIEMHLRHSENFPFPRVNQKEKTTYSIDELISSMEKFDPDKIYIDSSKKQDFLSAYENYKNELILTFYFTQFSLFQSSSPKFKNIDKVSKNNEIHWAKHFS